MLKKDCSSEAILLTIVLKLLFSPPFLNSNSGLCEFVLISTMTRTVDSASVLVAGEHFTSAKTLPEPNIATTTTTYSRDVLLS